MTNERYARAKAIFLDICDLAPRERAARLEDACRDDEAVGEEVQSLVANYDEGRADECTSAVPADGAGGAPPDSPIVGAPAGDGGRPRHGGTQPQQIGPYRIVRELDQGGMGIVYLAQRDDGQFQQKVALKVLHPHRGMDRDFLRRFERERQVLATLSHPNIARLYDGGTTDDGLPYFVMEYVEGMPLSLFCDRNRLRIEERLEIFARICDAVHHAHCSRLIHRDLKPGNILVRPDGEPVLLDFGIAKPFGAGLDVFVENTTAAGPGPMTPEYASPEQVRGDPITTASDVYTLGVILYELVSGHRPYRVTSNRRADLERVICDEAPENPSTAISRTVSPHERSGRSSDPITPDSVSRSRETRPERLRRRLAGDVDNIVLMAMRKETLRRYPSAEALAEDVRRHLRGEPVRARPATVGYQASKFVRRHRVGVAAALWVLLSLVGVATAMAVAWRSESEKAQLEHQRAQLESEKAEIVRDQRDDIIDLVDGFIVKANGQLSKLDGAIQLRETLVEVCVALLASVETWSQDDPSLLSRLAQLYELRGDIEGGIRGTSRGDHELALSWYRRALTIWTDLREADPDDEALTLAYWSAQMSIADMLDKLDEAREALIIYRGLLEFREAQVRQAPDDAGAKRLLAIALINVGKMQVKLGDRAGAILHYARSQTIREDQLSRSPHDVKLLRGVSVGLLRLGFQAHMIGDLDRAAEALHRNYNVRASLVEFKGTRRERRDAVMAAIYLAGLLVDQGKHAEAIDLLRSQLKIAEQIQAADPVPARSDRDVIHCGDVLGWALLASGDYQDAGRVFGVARAASESLISSRPPDSLHYQLRGECEEGDASVSFALGKRDEAIRLGQAAYETFHQVLASNSENALYRHNTARIAALLGTWLIERDPDSARRYLNEALDVLIELRQRDPQHVQLRRDHAMALVGLGRLAMFDGNPDRAITHVDEAEPIAPEVMPRVRANVLAVRADALLATGHEPEGIASLREAIELADRSHHAEGIALKARLQEDLRRHESG